VFRRRLQDRHAPPPQQLSQHRPLLLQDGLRQEHPRPLPGEQAHKKFLATTKKSAHLKRHQDEPGEAAKAVERRLVARVAQPDACPAWLLGRCYVPACPRAHPDFEVVTPSIRCCSLYRPSEAGYNKRKSTKCAYALNMVQCPYLHDDTAEDDAAGALMMHWEKNPEEYACRPTSQPTRRLCLGAGSP